MPSVQPISGGKLDGKNILAAAPTKQKASEKIRSFFSSGSSSDKTSKSRSNSNSKSINTKRSSMISDDTRRRSSSLVSMFTPHDDGGSSTESASHVGNELIDSVRHHNSFNPTKIIQDYKSQLDKWDHPLLYDPVLDDSEYRFSKDKHFSKFIPKPSHIKFIKKSKTTPDITKRLFLAQELSQNFTQDELNSNPDLVASLKANGITPDDMKNSVWVMKFNSDGKYLATAGKGNTIKVWKVLSTPLDKLQTDDSPINSLGGSVNETTVLTGPEKPAQMETDKSKKILFAPVFQNTCYRHYVGHEHDILSLDWSKNDFIISSSMDKTVRLWNIKEMYSLRTYQHTDFVTCVKFHPTDDRFFVSGCLDHRVRLWSILDNEVVYEFNAKNLVTSVGFTPNGSLVIVGTFTGVLYFLDTQNLELRHSLDLHKTKKNIIAITSSNGISGQTGSNSSCKVTGIESYQDDDDIKILITTNDSKIRLLSLKQRSLEFYFKGLENSSSQIIATVSDDKKYLISGSENHSTYIWELHGKNYKINSEDLENSTNPIKLLLNNKKKRKDYIAFHSNHSVVTAALIAPIGTSKALALSNDYIYELSNEYYSNVTAPSENASDADTGLFQSTFIGQIIVTADDRGTIRVFRKDISPEIRERLCNANKSSKKFLLNDDPNTDSKATLTKHQNCSSSSLLRADSISQRLRTSASLLNNAIPNQITDQIPNSLANLLNLPLSSNSAASSQTERSRSGTIGSIQRSLNNLDLDESPGGVTCDICAGDKFKVVKNPANGIRKDLAVFCVECGNQIST